MLAPARAFAARVAPTGVRCMSTADVDWNVLRSKLQSETGRAELTRQKNAFEARLAATQRVGAAPDIDWDHYSTLLPEYNMAEIRSNFEAFMSNLGDIPYNEAEDLAAHNEREEKAKGLQVLSLLRAQELAEAEEEAEDFALHDFTGAHELYLRHPGLYEAVNQEVNDREWYRDLDPVDKPNELTEEEQAAEEMNLLARGGLSPADVKSA